MTTGFVNGGFSIAMALMTGGYFRTELNRMAWLLS